MKVFRPLLLALSLIGALLFGAAFAASVLNPVYVEGIAKGLIKRQIEQRTHEKIDALDARFLSGKAGILLRSRAQEMAHAKQQLRAQVPERLAAVIAEMGQLDCECRKQIGDSIRKGYEWQILEAGQMQARLTALMRAQYMETAGKLTREFRIFTGTNAVVFLLLGVAAWRKRGAGLQLLPPALALLAAASLTAGLYLFNQDWLHTIVFSDYVGASYIAYLAVVFVFLCDVLFNRARATTRLMNMVFSTLGSSVQILPC